VNVPLPRPLKQQLGRVLGRFNRDAIIRELRALGQGSEPIVAGPWLGEVGFELLYWVPFLAWAVDECGIDPARLVVISRGGTGDWYRHLTSRYHDVLDHLSPAEFRARNEQRAAEVGEQKQAVVTGVERDLLGPILLEIGADAGRVLHPSLMYRLYQPYWFGHAGIDWVEAHARYTTLPAPAATHLDGSLDALPAEYTAVKFYYNDSFPATPPNRELARTVMAGLIASGPVVSLSTGLAIDDHLEWEDEAALAVHTLGAGVSPATNLGRQSAIVAHARRWVGTYGGFAYLAPFHGVPSTAYYSDRGAFSARHLHLVEHVLRRLAATSSSAHPPTSLLTLRDAA
jgi:hypothetical protein